MNQRDRQTDADQPLLPGQTPQEFEEEKAARRNRNLRTLLWSAVNHLQAAQALVEEQYDALDPAAPSESVSPFVLLEIAIHSGTAAEHFLKALILSTPKPRNLRKLDRFQLFSEAKRTFSTVGLHEPAIEDVQNCRNRAIHHGRAPDRGTAIRNVLATEEFASYVVKELSRADSSVLAEVQALNDFQESEAVSDAMREWESDVRDRVSAAAASYAARTAGRDPDEVAALLELEREGWLAAADPAARYVDRDCPACGSTGYVILVVEHLDVGNEETVAYAHVDRFLCVACGLGLGSPDLPFAGITDTYSDPHPDLLFDS